MFRKGPLQAAAAIGIGTGLYTFHQNRRWKSLNSSLNEKVDSIARLLEKQQNGEDVAKNLLIAKDRLADLDDDMHEIPVPFRYLFEVIENDCPPMKRYLLLDHSEDRVEKIMIRFFPHSFNTSKEIVYCRKTKDGKACRILAKRARRSLRTASDELSAKKIHLLEDIDKKEAPHAFASISFFEPVLKQSLAKLIPISNAYDTSYDIARFKPLYSDGEDHWSSIEKRYILLYLAARSFQTDDVPEITGALKGYLVDFTIMFLVRNALESYRFALD